MAQVSERQMLEPLRAPEAAAYPAQMKGDSWVATDTQFFVAGWNTNLVKTGEEPKSFEDFASTKWQGVLMGEPNDYMMLAAFAKRKHRDEKAIELFKRIAANRGEFSRGHSQLIEFLIAGQRGVCFTRYSHHFPPRIKKVRRFRQC